MNENDIGSMLVDCAVRFKASKQKAPNKSLQGALVPRAAELGGYCGLPIRSSIVIPGSGKFYRKEAIMTKSVGVKLDDELQKRLKALGERMQRSPHWLIKKAISEFVERAEEEERERQLLQDRWNRYQETEEGIPHETVVKWLETWGTDKEGPCPANRN